jgi:hypothetical protein
MSWYGQLAERLKALAWKASWRETVAGFKDISSRNAYSLY